MDTLVLVRRSTSPHIEASYADILHSRSTHNSRHLASNFKLRTGKIKTRCACRWSPNGVGFQYEPLQSIGNVNAIAIHTTWSVRLGQRPGTTFQDS
jgi:hypothetical protein